MEYGEGSEADGIHDTDPDPNDWLAAIIEGSEDAIISKDLSGRIRSWNAGAARLFGYTPKEAIGRPITMLIPEDRLDEEPRILAQIRRGHRVEHFETVRRRKDGTNVELSLTISPIRNADGVIVGASKIARDISDKKLNEERVLLLMGEMQHRVKNLFALATAVVSLSARSGSTTQEVIGAIHARLSALARAHELTLTSWQNEVSGQERSDLLSLIRIVLEPYRDGDCIFIDGASTPVGSKAATSIALLVHELATNAAKYGSLSVPGGCLAVRITHDPGAFRIDWIETEGPPPPSDMPAGFGSRLEKGLSAALGASITRAWKPSGLVAAISIPQAALEE